jgi:TadE-like protein
LGYRVDPRAAHARRDRSSGQALLELALVVPVIALLALAIFQFAFVIESQMGMTNALREAGRRVAASQPAGIIDWNGTETNFVVRQLCGTTPGSCNSGLLHDNVQGFDDSRLWSGYPAVTFCTDAVGGVPQYRVQIEVKYSHPVFFGLLAFATDLVDGTPNNGAWDIGASAQMRMEKIDDSVGGFQSPTAACT